MSNIDYEAEPLSRANIRDYATNIRAAIGFDQTPYIPIGDLLEFVLPRVMPDFFWDVWEKQQMGASHGLANRDTNSVILRNDVYVGACNGVGRDRFTVIHEIGHLLLHHKDRLSLRRAVGKPKVYRDPEWQANCFAGEFLVSHKLVNQFHNVLEVSSAFGVSMDAARKQLKEFAKNGIWQK